MKRNSHLYFLLITPVILCLFIAVQFYVLDVNFQFGSRPRSRPYTSKAALRLMENSIRKHYLHPFNKSESANYTPSSVSREGKFSYEQNTYLAMQVAEIMNFSRKGVFVEYAVSDGVDDSNTVLLESDYGWTGLLITAPRLGTLTTSNITRNLLQRNRHAWVGDFCLTSKQNHTSLVKPSKSLKKKKQSKGVTTTSWTKIRSPEAKCFPLDIVLRVAGIKRVDFLSLHANVQRNQPLLLAMFPFRRIPVKVISVTETKSNKRMVKWILGAKGFLKVRINKRGTNLTSKSLRRPLALYVSKKLITGNITTFNVLM